MLKTTISLFEVIIVIITCTFIGIIFLPNTISDITHSNNFHSTLNLNRISKAITAYNLEHKSNYHLCEVLPKHRIQHFRARDNKYRSSVKTFQNLLNHSSEIFPSNLITNSNESLRPPERRASGKYEPLTSENIGYHYVNGSTSKRLLGEEKVLIRDLNNGFGTGYYGNIMKANGSVETVKSTDRNYFDRNYKKPWYRNRDQIPNYKDFDNWSKGIVPNHRPDEVD